MVKTDDLILIGGVGLAAYLLFIYKNVTAPANEGGSLLQQAQDATIGQLIGTPSRNGSLGTVGALGSAYQDVQGANALVFGTQSVNGGVGTPNILSQAISAVSTGFNNVFPVGTDLNPTWLGNNQAAPKTPANNNSAVSAVTASVFSANPPTTQQFVASTFKIPTSSVSSTTKSTNPTTKYTSPTGKVTLNPTSYKIVGGKLVKS